MYNFCYSSHYLLITVLIPFFSAIVILLTGKWPKVSSSVTIISAILLFAYLAPYLNFLFNYLPDYQFIFVDFNNNLHISLILDVYGVIFALLVSFLWVLTSIYTVCYMQKSHASFLCLLSVSIGCTIFIAFSGDLLTTFIFYELLTITTYPLITYGAAEGAITAGRSYLRTLFFSSLVLFLPAIGLLYNKFNTLDFSPLGIFKSDASLTSFAAICFAMLIYGIGKAALMPMHFWLPKAMVASVPVSALLHAVAVVKSGVFIIMRVISYIFGIKNLRYFIEQNWLAGGWLPYAAGITIVISSLIALKQKELKALLAYSTISQLSYIILFTSVVYVPYMTHLNMSIAMLQLVCHAFAKITLFFVAGNITLKTGETCIDRMHGIGRSMPIAMVAFTISALCMIGVPPAPTFYTKLFVLKSLFNNSATLIIFTLSVLAISTILNALYFLPIIYHAFFSKPTKNFSIKIPTLLTLPPIITTTCTLALFLSCLSSLIWFYKYL